MKFSFRPGQAGAANMRGIEAALREDGFSGMFSWTDPPGAVHPPHDHEYDHRVTCVRGEIEFTVDEKEYLLRPGDQIDLPRRTIHSARTVGNQSVTYIISQP